MANRFHNFCRSFFSDNVYGGALIVFSTAASATTNSTTHSIPSHIPAMQVLFCKCFFGLVLLLLFYRVRFFSYLKTNILPIHMLKGTCGALGNWAWIGAVQNLPLAESSALSITSAFFTSLGGMYFFKEKFLKRAWIAIIFGFLGVVTIVHPSSKIFSFYAFLPLISAIFFSASSLFVKRISKNDSSQTTLIYLLLIMAIISFATQFYIPWQFVTFSDIFKFMVIGSSYVLTQACLIEAYTYAHTSFLAPFKYARFPLNVLTGLVFFLEIPSITTLIGGAIILISYAWLIKFEYKAKIAKNSTFTKN